jgi:hypothetical protein
MADFTSTHTGLAIDTGVTNITELNAAGLTVVGGEVNVANGLTIAGGGNSTGIAISNAATTANIIQIDNANALTTGSILSLESNSNSIDIRSLVDIHNSHVLAINTIGLNVVSDSTGYVARFKGTGGVLIDDGALILTALSGGGTTGLSIDNDGKIIRTPP